MERIRKGGRIGERKERDERKEKRRSEKDEMEIFLEKKKKRK